MLRVISGFCFVIITIVYVSAVSYEDEHAGSCPESTTYCELSPPAHIDPSIPYYDNEDDSYGDYSYSSETQSNTSWECIPDSSVCNGVMDCYNCTDEVNCTTPTTYWCLNDQDQICIPISKRCDNNSDCNNGEDECGCPGSIQCENFDNVMTCIPPSLRCDGKFDCLNRQDEIDSCEVFVCPSNLKKIPAFQLCDGKNDCFDSNRSDECNCLTTFVCPSGECINKTAMCDGDFDCRDGMDECNCPEDRQLIKTFHCSGSGSCIKANKVCDGKLDCGSYYVEDNKTSGLSHHVIDCSDETQGNCSRYFQCYDASRSLQTGKIYSDLQTCVHSSLVCNGNADCLDGSDECECMDSVPCSAGGSKRCMLRSNFCDAIDNCGDGSDEINQGFGIKCMPQSSNYKGNPCVVPEQLLNDGVLDCVNGADECYRNGKWRCFRCFDQSYLISDEQICDGVIDCPDLSDECACNESRPSLCGNVCGMDRVSNCDLGNIRCEDDSRNDSVYVTYKFIPFSSICDDINECLDSSVYVDEKFCLHEEHSQKDMKCPLGDPFNPLRPLEAARCDNRTECAGFADECDPNHPCDIIPLLCQNVSTSVDPRLRGELRFLCPDGILRSSKSPSIFGLPGPFVCDGIVDCSGAGEDELEKICPQRFYCDAGNNVISIDKSKVCDGIIHCIDRSDEVNCSEHFYCENGDPFFVPKAVRFDGFADCGDRSDECPTKQLEGAFASNIEMIASPFLRAMVWIMAVISTVGNIIVICHQIKIFLKRKKLGTQNVALSNRVMLLNLAVADLLTGIYLFLIAAKTIQFSGDYCNQDKYWRTSSSCANLGLLNSVATETAVVILLLMTTYRLLAVYKPFYTASISPMKIEFICFGTWFIVIVFMMFPRLNCFSDYFSQTAWYPLPFFDSDVVEKEDIVDFIHRYYVLTENPNVTLEKSWTFIKNFANQHSFNNKSRFALFSYYSKHSVCIPNMLAATNDAGVAFSAIITSFNLIAFAYVVIAYMFIYKGAMEKSGAKGNSYSSNPSFVLRSQSTKPLTGDKDLLKPNAVKTTSKSTIMQRKIYRLVFSNLACWVPITIMALLKLCHVELPNDAYAAAAVVLLPITSALNPILYSNFFSYAWDRLQLCICKKTIDQDQHTQDRIPGTGRSQMSESLRSAKL